MYANDSSTSPLAPDFLEYVRYTIIILPRVGLRTVIIFVYYFLAGISVYHTKSG
jgi:hypothetical protein